MLRKLLPIRSLKLAMLVVTVLALAIAIVIESTTYDARLNWLLMSFMLVAGTRVLAERPPRKTFWVGFLVFSSVFLYVERSYLDDESLYSLYIPAMVAGQSINRHEFGEVVIDSLGQPVYKGQTLLDARSQPTPVPTQPPTQIARYQMLAFGIAAEKSQQAHRRAFPFVVIAIGFLGGAVSSWAFRPRT